MRLVGCVPLAATITLGLRRRDLLARVDECTDHELHQRRCQPSVANAVVGIRFPDAMGRRWLPTP